MVPPLQLVWRIHTRPSSRLCTHRLLRVRRHPSIHTRLLDSTVDHTRVTVSPTRMQIIDCRSWGTHRSTPIWDLSVTPATVAILTRRVFMPCSSPHAFPRSFKSRKYISGIGMNRL